MHLYLAFTDGKITGEGTDYIGPWNASGTYDVDTGVCRWIKQYLGKHQVHYQGKVGQQGIQGEWTISYLTGPFHIWPKSQNYLNELYMQEELNVPVPSIELGLVPAQSDFV